MRFEGMVPVCSCGERFASRKAAGLHLKEAPVRDAMERREEEARVRAESRDLRRLADMDEWQRTSELAQKWGISTGWARHWLSSLRMDQVEQRFPPDGPRRLPAPRVEVAAVTPERETLLMVARSGCEALDAEE